jgi:hypothetical protein
MQAKLTVLLEPAFAAAGYISPSSLIAAGPLQPTEHPCNPHNGTRKKLNNARYIQAELHSMAVLEEAY